MAIKRWFKKCVNKRSTLVYVLWKFLWILSPTFWHFSHSVLRLIWTESLSKFQRSHCGQVRSDAVQQLFFYFLLMIGGNFVLNLRFTIPRWLEETLFWILHFAIPMWFVRWKAHQDQLLFATQRHWNETVVDFCFTLPAGWLQMGDSLWWWLCWKEEIGS